MRGRPDVYSGGSDDDEAARPPRSRLVIAAGVAAVVLSGALVVALLQDDGGSSGQSLGGTPSSEPTSAAPSTDSTAPIGTDVSGGPSSSPMSSGAAKPPDSVGGVVERFATAWLLRTSAEQRRKALTPVATASLVDGLALTDVSLLPPAGTTLAGEPSMQSGTPTQGIYLQRFSDGESILVTAGYVGSGHWLVVDVQSGPQSAAG